MLDSTSCLLSDGSWLTFKGQFIVKVLRQFGSKHGIALFVAAMSFLVFIYPKIVRRFRPDYQARLLKWRQWLLRVGFGGFIIGLFLLSPMGLNWANRGLITFLPTDSGETADAIVILGRGGSLQRDRVEAAVELWQEHRAPRIFVSGRGDAPKILNALRQMGLPDEVLDGENCSQTTDENAKLTAYSLRPKGVHRIILLTDAPHMQRSRLTLQSFGFEVIPHISSGFPELHRRDNVMMLLYEYGGLLSYAVKGRFLPRDIPQLPSLAKANELQQVLPPS